MTVNQILAFYAPFAGLLGVVFWLGVLTQTVKDLRKDVDALQKDGGAGGTGERMVRLEANVDNVIDKVDGIEATLRSISDQLSRMTAKSYVRGLDPSS